MCPVTFKSNYGFGSLEGWILDFSTKMKKSNREEKKEEKERHATWLELFYDLVFVAVVSQLSENLDHDISLMGLLSFVALFIPVWFAWLGATFFATRFGTDDLVHRILTLLQMMGAAAMAVNVSHGLGETSAGFALMLQLDLF